MEVSWLLHFAAHYSPTKIFLEIFQRSIGYSMRSKDLSQSQTRVCEQMYLLVTQGYFRIQPMLLYKKVRLELFLTSNLGGGGVFCLSGGERQHVRPPTFLSCATMIQFYHCSETQVPSHGASKPHNTFCLVIEGTHLPAQYIYTM